MLSGVRIGALEASDALDVIHFLFEQDTESFSTAEQVEARDAVRERLYSSLYNTSYRYKISSKKTATADFSLDDPLDDLPTPVDPLARSGEVKGFIPATNFNPDAAKPFGSILDAPLG